MRFLIDGLIGLMLIGLLVGVLLLHRKQQRLLVDSLIALLLVGVLASVLLYRRHNLQLIEQYAGVQQALATLQDQVAYQAALEVGKSGDTVFPAGLSPLWFNSGLPLNTAVPGWHPWLDVAPQGDLDDHPPDPIVKQEVQAGLWYNPNRGVVRARVTDQGSDMATLQLYNRLNGSELEMLPASRDPARMPLALMSILLVQATQPGPSQDDQTSQSPADGSDSNPASLQRPSELLEAAPHH